MRCRMVGGCWRSVLAVGSDSHGSSTESALELMWKCSAWNLTTQSQPRPGGLPGPIGCRLLCDLVGTIGSFDLIFPDAPGGKIFKLRKTISTLRPGGFLLVDDMDLSVHSDPELRNGLASVRERLIEHPDLVCAELPFASGVIIASKRRI